MGLDGTPAERAANPYSLQQYIADFAFNGHSYPQMLYGNAATDREEPSGFEGFVQSAYRSNGVVFACMLARLAVFSDARFMFRKLSPNGTGDLIAPTDGRNPYAAGLQLLRTPWIGGTTGDLLARMIQDADMAGNAFVARVNGQLVRLRPDWVSIIASTPGDASLWHPRAEVLGYLYNPGGDQTQDEPVPFLREEVAHFAPIPDPTSRFRGISWVDSVWAEIAADKSATAHKQKFFENGATVNLALTYPEGTTAELFEFAQKSFATAHEGVNNAHRTLHLLGAVPSVVGANLEQADFKSVQGAGETRIAAAAGVPPIIVGLSEGLAAATYSNYGQARRAFADRTIRPLWRNACGSLAQIIPEPPDHELWYDDRDVAFIREDQKDAADIRAVDATTIKTLIDAGFEPDSATTAVTSSDLRLLDHTGMVSVQLQKPGEKQAAPEQLQLPAVDAQPSLTDGGK